ncbi:hypothetical protein BKA62DRAFT_615082 [Auriculariales sp. MPI-PUGE-AT-0066]|nr:hypothetical protein BKA62DRAFT_615082 [Auriculariales sp. MPI-PUGE-AT-0066]
MVHLTLTIALSHAISFLTKPLAVSISAKTVEHLRQQLEVKLREEFAPTWHPDQPQRGSNTRCMTLSPARLPPRTLLAACFAARLPWSQWMQALGNAEFDLFIDPGSVSVLRRGEKSHRIVWSSSTHSGAYDAQRDDDEIEEVLDIINRKVIVSDSWLSPTSPTFPTMVAAAPIPIPVVSRLDTAFIRSRCASRISNSSGSDDGHYDSDAVSAPPSLMGSASMSSVSSRAASPAPGSSSRSSGKYVPPARRAAPAPAATHAISHHHQSPRPNAAKRFSTGSSSDEAWRPVQREENVVVDANKAKLTVYAGKTTVMSGGVMMGRRA